ncbi:MAG: signal peptidase I [Xanthobacteraceae bacterium]
MSTVRHAEKVPVWKSGIFAVLAFAVIALAISLPLLFRAYLFQPFGVPAGSMVPTLLVGDFFFAAKYAYAPIWGAVPARGDVVVFRSPRDNVTVFVKRVAGLPDDRIQMKQGILHINGVAVTRERTPNFVGEDPCGERAAATGTRRWRETLDNGVSYETLDCVDVGFLDNTSVYTVPEGRIFVLGDNRDNSTDSRLPSSLGYVPIENVIGRAGMIFFSRKPGKRGQPGDMRWGRIGMLVR